MVATGALIGTLVAVGFARGLPLAFEGVDPGSPLQYAATALLLLAVAAAGAHRAAGRAARLEPAEALG